MSELLYHPAVQSGLLPFTVALMIIILPGSYVSIRPATAILLAFLISAGLTLGWHLLPLTSTSKLILGVALAFIIASMIRSPGRRFVLLVALAVGLPIWMLWPVIIRMGSDLPIHYALVPIFSLYLVYTLSWYQSRPREALSIMFALSMGTGLCAIIGASIVYGQLAFGLGAGIGAVALWYLIRLDAGLIRHLPQAVAVAVGTICGGATVFASVPAITLGILALVPLMAQLPVPRGIGDRASFLVMSFYCLPPVILAVAIVWFVAGPVTF